MKKASDVFYKNSLYCLCRLTYLGTAGFDDDLTYCRLWHGLTAATGDLNARLVTVSPCNCQLNRHANLTVEYLAEYLPSLR